MDSFYFFSLVKMDSGALEIGGGEREGTCSALSLSPSLDHFNEPQKKQHGYHRSDRTQQSSFLVCESFSRSFHRK